MEGYTQVMLEICQKETETWQGHCETVEIAKTAKSHILRHFSKRCGCFGDLIIVSTRPEACQVAIGIQTVPLRGSPG